MIVDQVAEEKVQASSLARYVCVCARKKSMCLNWMEPKYAASDFSQEPLPKALFPPRITMCVCAYTDLL